MRISPELHRDAQMRAIQENRSLNEVMTQALENLLHGGHGI
ncbi:MAG: toxin-antitoxin system HicB family antitoxin [Acidithiobacillus sp.]